MTDVEILQTEARTEALARFICALPPGVTGDMLEFVKQVFSLGWSAGGVWAYQRSAQLAGEREHGA